MILDAETKGSHYGKCMYAKGGPQRSLWVQCKSRIEERFEATQEGPLCCGGRGNITIGT